MIPFASQRGNGRDLATHLMNSYDNDLVEVASIRGAIARDLHGAFKEWEVQAAALTKCREYVYSLSINPDPAQAPLTREQYKDYIARAEKALGLTGQPRAIVYHSKFGREHCHVVWSRIDVKNEKAVQLAFDKEKLMTVTRGFARDHGLTLPPGYDKSRGVGQRSLKDQARLLKTGLSVDDHKAQITEAWRHCDDNRSFTQSLAERGYVLAAGRRGYCVVDLYGNTSALSRMIDDKSVRKADVEAFMGKEFPLESLPTVEEAERLVAQHRSEMEKEEKSDQLRDRQASREAELKHTQALRRQDTQGRFQALREAHEQQSRVHDVKQREARDTLRREHLMAVKATRLERSLNRPRGLAGFLGKISGVAFLRQRIDRHHDGQKAKAFTESKRQLGTAQRQERQALVLSQRIEIKEIERQVKALDSIDSRELASLARDEQRDRYVLARGPEGVMPSLIELLREPKYGNDGPPDMQAEFGRATRGQKARLPDIEGDFERASRGHDSLPNESGEGTLLGSSRPPDQFRPQPNKSKERDQDRDLS